MLNAVFWCITTFFFAYLGDVVVASSLQLLIFSALLLVALFHSVISERLLFPGKNLDTVSRVLPGLTSLGDQG